MIFNKQECYWYDYDSNITKYSWQGKVQNIDENINNGNWEWESDVQTVPCKCQDGICCSPAKL